MNARRFSQLAAAAVATLLGAGPLTHALEITWYSIDGGGATYSTGGSLELGATTGQADAVTVLSGGDLELSGGFWFGLAEGDCNADGAVTLLDFGDFSYCLTGPGVDNIEASCSCFDFDGDLDVDFSDWAVFQTSFHGG